MAEKRRLDFTISGFLIFENKLLLIKHKQQNMWLAPGGHFKYQKNESPDEALKREFIEEMRLDIAFPQIASIPAIAPLVRNLPLPFYSNIHNVGDHDHFCLYYLCKTGSIYSLTPDEKEMDAFQWFSEKELKNSKEITPYLKAIGFLAFETAKRLKKRL